MSKKSRKVLGYLLLALFSSLCTSKSALAQELNSPTCESIVVADYTGLRSNPENNGSLNEAKDFVFHIDRILKGPKIDGEVLIRNDLDEASPQGLDSSCCRPLPASGTKWILFIPHVSEVPQPFATFNGQLGRVEYDEWFLDKLAFYLSATK